MVALKTFHNLPEARKQEIIAVALQEFALNDFQSASLSTIIAKLNLAKGSFYRYFESKQTLYYYLLDHCVEVRLQHDAELIGQPPADFFELILEHFRARVQFDKKFPLLSAFLNKVLHEKNSPDLGNIQLLRKQKVHEIVKALVEAAVQKGGLRHDIDIDAMAWMVVQTQLSIIDFVEQRYGEDMQQNIKQHQILYSIPEQEVLDIARQFVDMLKLGIAPKTRIDERH